MRSNPRPQEMYRHFKGNIYQIRCLAKHSETGEMMVVYQAMYDTFQIYARPLDMFMEEVDHDKYPDVKQKYRFELVQDTDNTAELDEARDLEQMSDRIQTDAAGQADMAETEMSARTETESLQEVSVQTAESDEQVHIDPLVMEFLDADTYEQRLDILAALHDRVTDDMINTMAVAVDLEIKDGDIEERYTELKRCLITFEKYECNRLR